MPVALPRGGLEWALAGTASLLVGLGDLYPGCESELTPEIMLAANIATNHYNLDTAKSIEAFRRDLIVQMAQLFEQVDFIICATNPDVAFGAQGPMPTTIDGVDLIAEYGFETAVGNNGALTIPANTTGHPAVAIPIGTVDGLPVSMQVIGRRHAEQLLLDLARVVELRAAVAAGGARRTASDRPTSRLGHRRRPSKGPHDTRVHTSSETGRQPRRNRLTTVDAHQTRSHNDPTKYPLKAMKFWVPIARVCDFRYLLLTKVCRTLTEPTWRKRCCSLLPDRSRCRLRSSRSKRRVSKSAPISRNGCSRVPPSWAPRSR